jgi:hypothetical protein
MADGVRFDIDGANNVTLRFEEFPTALHDKLIDRIGQLTNDLASAVRSAAPYKSGKLQNSIRGVVYDDSPKKITGRVSVSKDFAKAGALEYGAHAEFSLRGHAAKLDHFWSKKLNAPIEVFVAAHDRTPNIEAHSFLRGPLHMMSSMISALLNEAVSETVEVTGGE